MELIGYMDTAKARAGLPSERRFAIALGVSHQTLRLWRVGLSVPQPELMLRLAELAGVPGELALLDRMAWLADGPRSRDIVSRIRSQMALAVASMTLVFVLNSAALKAQGHVREMPVSEYYGNFALWVIGWIQWLNLPAAIAAPPRRL
jgi:hypothetical protein